jgi:hypothetical protein
MTKAFTPRILIAAASAALITGALFSPAAQAITDTVFRYSTPKTAHLGLMPAAFTPGILTSNYFNSGEALTPATTNQTCWFAPVNLPHGAKMTALAMWYMLESPDLAIIQLVRTKFSDGAETQIVSESAPADGGYRPVNYPITGAVQVVDNQRYGYYVRVCLEYDGAGTSPSFRGARVTYTYTNAGD